MDKLIYKGFLKSFAWREYFNSLKTALSKSRRFSARYHKSGETVPLRSFVLFLTEEGTAICYIDTQREIEIPGATLRHPSLLAEVEGNIQQWTTRLTPLNSLIEVSSKKPLSQLEVKFYGDEADVQKLYTDLSQVKVNLNSSNPPILTKRKLSSLELFKQAVSELGVTYSIDFNKSQKESYETQEGIEILISEGREVWFISKLQVLPGDELIVNGKTVRVLEKADNHLLLSDVCPVGKYTLISNNRDWAPLLTEATSSVEVVLDSREKKDEVTRLFEREKPFRLKGKVVYLDLTLEAELDLNVDLELDRAPLIVTFDPKNPEKRIQDVWLDWKVGSTVPILVGVKNADWKTEPKWWISGIDNHGDKYTVQVDPNHHTSQIAEVIFQMLQSNRQYEEFIVEVEFETTPNETSDLEAEPYKHIVRVHIKPWDPEIFEVAICETLGAHGENQDNDPVNITDFLGSTESAQAQRPVDVQDTLGTQSEAVNLTPTDVWDQLMFESEAVESDVLTITPTLKQIDHRGTVVDFTITSTKREWIAFVKRVEKTR